MSNQNHWWKLMSLGLSSFKRQEPKRLQRLEDEANPDEEYDDPIIDDEISEGVPPGHLWPRDEYFPGRQAL